MDTTTPLTHAPPRPATGRLIVPRRRCSASSPVPSWRDVFDERGPILGAPAFFGPPVVYLLGPWLLLILLLIGPFVAAVTVVFALAVGAALLAASAVVMASPYLLVRHLRAHHTVHPASLSSSHHELGADRPRSLQPKGVS